MTHVVEEGDDQGFELDETIYRLKFSGKLEGLVVTAYEPPLGFLEDAAKMAPLAGKSVDQMTPEDLLLVSRFFGGFADHLIDWNLKKRGVAVPPTVEGLKAQGMGLVMEIVEAWLDAVGEVPDPLAPPSSSGRPSLEGSLPMESLSPSQPSLPGPSSSSTPPSDSDAFLVG